MRQSFGRPPGNKGFLHFIVERGLLVMDESVSGRTIEKCETKKWFGRFCLEKGGEVVIE